jgi:predicted metal-dependent phosphoesterase TrpH
VIDLHVHSTFSDGSLTPAQLAGRGREIGLKALALTDHDTTAGLAALAAACGGGGGPEPVPGVEISVDVAKGTLHMLGYYVDASNAALEKTLARIREGREDRNRVILDKLRALGMALEWDEVAAYAGEDVVGRPHFARAMAARGYVSSTAEAFDRYLAKGKPAYTERFRLLPAESVAAIRAAGGVPVLAHPFTLELSAAALAARAAELKEAGLGGIEAYYSEHSSGQTEQYVRLARSLDLAVTGGSDFHGENNPAIRLGVGFGSLRVPDDLLEDLRRRAGG